MKNAGGKRAVLIAGPTASGKSALALARAEHSGGIIVNADAMQVYDVLHVLTARPPAAETSRHTHLLYGFLSPIERFSTGSWLRRVKRLVDEHQGRELIFVGGTGLYFEALLNGIAEVPEVDPSFVEAAEMEIAGLSAGQREALLASRDPLMAGRLAAADPQRVVRALSVLAATGRSLASFQAAKQVGLLRDFVLERLVVEVEPAVLAERIARRFETMVDNGAVEEVEALLALGLDPALPAMKAIGVRAIGDWLAGRSSREEAIELGAIATRQYAKRQRTWLRNRMGDWPRHPSSP